MTAVEASGPGFRWGDGKTGTGRGGDASGPNCVRGDAGMAEEVVTIGRSGVPQAQRRTAKKFSAVRQKLFLDHLARTCNVRASAAEAGIHYSTVYVERRRNRAFADQWREAIAIGYDALEARLVELANRALDPAEASAAIDGGEPIVVSVADAIRLLQWHRQQRDTGVSARRGRKRRPTPEETDEAILRKLRVLDRAAGRAGT